MRNPNLLRKNILAWYRSRGRKLPWRRIRDPYRILVSEIMLHQTQVSRVLRIYPAFLRSFPTLRRLAAASPSEVIVAWRGMGYNRRALYLRRCAQRVVEEWKGRFPDDPDRLQTLPGIGRYTAHALACFAFRRQVPVVETNIRRVLERMVRKPLSDGRAWEVAAGLLPAKRAHEWNQALMDLGAMVCTAVGPSCGECPVRSQCPSAHRVRRVRKRPRMEHGRNGIPDRIYRGRVVEFLRDRRRPVRLRDLGRRTVPSLHRHDRGWFLGLLRSLERDGLVLLVRRGGTVWVSLAG